MATNSNVVSLLIGVYWILNLVSSLPAPAEVAASIGTSGIKLGTDVGTAANTAVSTSVTAATDAAAKVQGTAVQAATSSLDPSLSVATSAGKTVVDAAGKIQETTITAAKNGENTATSAASKVTGNTSLNFPADRATSTLSAASGLASGALTTGQSALTDTLGSLPLRTDLTGGFRNGLVGFVNLADQGTGQLNSGLRTGFTSGGGLIDGGLSAVGIQQPLVTPVTDAMWRVGENGRSTGFGAIRQGMGGSLLLVDPSLLAQPIGLASGFGVTGSTNGPSRLGSNQLATSSISGTA